MCARGEPFQLELFPTTVRLIRCVPALNQDRFYAIMATPTLFGQVLLLLGILAAGACFERLGSRPTEAS
jgi:hypothetical protein